MTAFIKIETCSLSERMRHTEREQREEALKLIMLAGLKFHELEAALGEQFPYEFTNELKGQLDGLLKALWLNPITNKLIKRDTGFTHNGVHIGFDTFSQKPELCFTPCYELSQIEELGVAA